ARGLRSILQRRQGASMLRRPGALAPWRPVTQLAYDASDHDNFENTFYLTCGMGANTLEIATAANSNVPGLEASGTIPRVLGTYLVLYTTSTVRALLPVSCLLIPLRVPTWFLIVVWFVWLLTAGVAHVGGFVTDVVLIWPFRQHDHVDR